MTETLSFIRKLHEHEIKSHVHEQVFHKDLSRTKSHYFARPAFMVYRPMLRSWFYFQTSTASDNSHRKLSCLVGYKQYALSIYQYLQYMYSSQRVVRSTLHQFVTSSSHIHIVYFRQRYELESPLKSPLSVSFYHVVAFAPANHITRLEWCAHPRVGLGLHTNIIMQQPNQLTNCKVLPNHYQEPGDLVDRLDGAIHHILNWHSTLESLLAYQ